VRAGVPAAETLPALDQRSGTSGQHRHGGAELRARRLGDKRWVGLFLVPTALILVATAVLPVVYSLGESLAGRQSAPARTSFGSAYASLATSSPFWSSLRVEAVFVVGATVVEVLLGTSVALLLNRPSRLATLVRSLLLAPAVLPTIVVALIFDYMLQNPIGAISYYLAKLGIHQAWLDHGGSALAVLIGIDVWQFTPFVALLALAALQGLPRETLEAAEIDGVNSSQKLRLVVIPQIAPALQAIALLRFIDAIQVFPTIYVLTDGGPGTSTRALNFYGFEEFFQYGNQATGAAISVVLVLVTIGLAVALTRVLRKPATPQAQA